MNAPALLLSALLAAAPATLRVDWFHAGDASQQLFTLDGQVREPLPWPGNPARAVDDSGLGGWRFEVHDAASGALRSFAEVSPAVKNALSHRGRAAALIAPFLAAWAA